METKKINNYKSKDEFGGAYLYNKELNLDSFISERTFANGPWDYFERAIARFLVHKGWDFVDLVGGSGDKGADVIASINNEEYVFQVKYTRNNRAITADIVGDVVSAMDYYNINKGICISNRNLNNVQKRKLEGYKSSGLNIVSFTSQRLLDSIRKLPDWIQDDRNPYNYQQECIDKIKDSYNQGDGKGLISLATGMGKTFVACSFIRWLYENNNKLNILILAHQDTLLKQFDRSLWTFLPKWIETQILCDGSKPFYRGGILLSTFGSFPNWSNDNPDKTFDIVVIDEAHHSRAITYEQVINMVNPHYLLGLTATPYRADGLSVTETFGKPLVYYSVADGIKKKYLCEVDYKLRAHNIDRDWITNNSMKGYTVKQLNTKLFIDERESKIIDLFLEYWKEEKRKRAVIFCQSVKHAQNIEKILKVNYDFKCSSITGATKGKNKENARRLRKFRNGELKALTVYNMFNEGVDVPDIDFICFLRVTHSRTYFLQQLGRGLRYKRGKKLLVLDFVADLRQIRAVQRQKNEFYDSGEEYLELEKGFKVEFSNDFTDDFLELVSKEIESEFLEENDLV